MSERLLITGGYVLSMDANDGELVGVDSSRVRGLAAQSLERVLSRVLAHGPLLPEATPEFAGQLDAFGKANIARAHELAHS